MDTTKIKLEAPEAVTESTNAEAGCCGGSCACGN